MTPAKDRPGNKRGNNKPSNRGSHAPKPQPQPVKGRGTTHGGKNKTGAGARQTRAPQSTWSQKGSNGSKKGDCCPMVAAVRAAGRGRFRLASRYARWSLHLMVAR